MHPRLPLFPEQASTLAPSVDYFFFFLIGVSLFFGVLIATLLIVFGIRYRRQPGRVPVQIHGSTALELVWTVVPFSLAMVIFFWGAWLFMEISRPPDDAHEVFVVGRQWMWKLQHLEGRREIDELHVPVGQAIKLTMTSEDVIHSFYVPAFRTKQDVIPGRYTVLWFKPTRVGEYHLFCAEYCGTQHSGMIGRVVVMEPAEFQAWLSEPSPMVPSAVSGGGQSASVSPAAAGEALFVAKACATCHQPQGGALGPSLIGVYGSHVKLQDGSEVVADDAYLRESILNPTARIVAGFQPVMPTFQGQLDEEQVLQLIQYIKSLKPAGEAPAHASAALDGSAPPS
jgi:cytochrome c oxidase subunit 2